MNEIDYLAKELKETHLDWTPSKHLMWMLVVALEELVPSTLIVGRSATRTKKAARLLFAREVTGRPITSFKQLKPGEIVRIKRWLEGNGPSPNDDKENDDRKYNAIIRTCDLVDFWMDNKQEVFNLARWLKVVKK